MSANPAVDVWRDETLGEAAVRALKRNGFDALYVKDIQDAAKKVMSFIKKRQYRWFWGVHDDSSPPHRRTG